MGLFREIPPTAGFPLYLKDFLSAFFSAGSLEQDFKHYLDLPYARITCSGTGAFYLILESLKNISPKKTVVIPSFVCPLVPLAIKRAGLKVAVCDINKENFDFDLRELEGLCIKNTDILAIVAVHLAGIPVDILGINRVAQKQGIFVIEDCAQALGAIYKGKRVGALGDFAFFSLCRGKGLTIYEGGVIVAKEKKYAADIDAAIKRMVKTQFWAETLKIMELFGYWIFYRPLLFWWVWRLPQLFWEWQKKPLKAAGEDFTIDFPLYNVSRLRQAVGQAAFWRLEKKIEKQRTKALFYIKELKDAPGIKLITAPPEATATYPFLSLIFDHPQKKLALQEIFRNSGLGISQVYAAAISDYPYLKDIVEKEPCPNARSLAERTITLSTSTFLKEKELAQIVKIIKDLK